MRIGRTPAFLAGLLAWTISNAQPAGYYASAEGLSGESLRQALHQIIDDHTVSNYSELWDHFYKTDRKPDGSVWDMYSDNPSGAEPYTYQFVTNQCGNYSGEGDCYNREHSFPKSWFGGEILPMFTDLFHLYPTDGYVNNQRSNHPYGETSSASWTSLNGSRVGPSSVTGYSGTVFEPIDAYKGDLARTCFYMAVRYYGEDGSWPGSDMTDGAEPLEWAIDMLLDWHYADQVSEKEIARNDSVYKIQGNRNPFIDHPEYVAAIWDVQNGRTGILDPGLRLYPHPADDQVFYRLPYEYRGEILIRIFTLSGSLLHEEIRHVPGEESLDVSTMDTGIYLLEIKTTEASFRQKLVVY